MSEIFKRCCDSQREWLEHCRYTHKDLDNQGKALLWAEAEIERLKAMHERVKADYAELIRLSPAMDGTMTSFAKTALELADKNKDLTLENGHLRHRFETMRTWSKSAESIPTQPVLELLNAPIPDLSSDQ